VAPHTLLTINGDIPDRQAGLKLAEQYGVDGIMIGRGIFQNPFAFEKEAKEHGSEELLNLLRLHLDLHVQYSAEVRRSFSALTRFFKIYVRGFRGANELRISLMNAKSTDEVRALLDEFGNKKNDGIDEH
jgi:tRNA-dihydrouridine synthase